MAEDGRRFMTSEHWRQSLGTVLMVSLMGAGSLVGATLWIVSAIHGVAETNLAAINVEAAVVAKIQAELEHRVTTLEAQEIDAARATDRLTTSVEQLRSTEGDLTTALQRLNDLLPAPMQRPERKR